MFDVRCNIEKMDFLFYNGCNCLLIDEFVIEEITKGQVWLYQSVEYLRVLEASQTG